MKVIIAGSRDISVSTAIQKIQEGAELFSAAYGTITAVLCGDARGVDRLGEQWAIARKISVIHYPALWQSEGRGAGFLRNARMVKAAEGAIFVWDGVSRGTKHCIELAEAKDIPHLVMRTDQ